MIARHFKSYCSTRPPRAPPKCAVNFLLLCYCCCCCFLLLLLPPHPPRLPLPQLAGHLVLALCHAEVLRQRAPGAPEQLLLPTTTTTRQPANRAVQPARHRLGPRQLRVGPCGDGGGVQARGLPGGVWGGCFGEGVQLLLVGGAQAIVEGLEGVESLGRPAEGRGGGVVVVVVVVVLGEGGGLGEDPAEEVEDCGADVEAGVGGVFSS